MAVLKKFADDQGGSLAAQVAYYGFFCFFPLLLVFVTVLAYILQGDTHFQHTIKNSVLSEFPIIGPQINGQIQPLRGQATAIIIGLVTSLLAGLGVTNAAQQALDRVWAVPFKERPDFLRRRLRGLGLVAVLGTMFVASTTLSGLVSGGVSAGLDAEEAQIVGIALSLAVNFLLFLVAFRFLTVASIKTSSLWLGAAFAALFWEILQVGGGLYINHVLRHTTSTYGLFGLVIAILVFFHLGAQMTLYAAEINVVASRKLWPRSLFGPAAVAADVNTLTALAKVEERDGAEHVDVEFGPPARPSGTAPGAPPLPPGAAPG